MREGNDFIDHNHVLKNAWINAKFSCRIFHLITRLSAPTMRLIVWARAKLKNISIRVPWGELSKGVTFSVSVHIIFFENRRNLSSSSLWPLIRVRDGSLYFYCIALFFIIYTGCVPIWTANTKNLCFSLCILQIFSIGSEFRNVNIYMGLTV